MVKAHGISDAAGRERASSDTGGSTSGDGLLSALFALGVANGAAAVVAALCERSRVVVALRDDDGRYVYSNAVLGSQVGGLDLRGRSRAGMTRYFDADGRELAVLEHPAQRVQRSGTAEANVRLSAGDSYETARHFMVSYVQLS